MTLSWHFFLFFSIIHEIHWKYNRAAQECTTHAHTQLSSISSGQFNERTKSVKELVRIWIRESARRDGYRSKRASLEKRMRRKKESLSPRSSESQWSSMTSSIGGLYPGISHTHTHFHSIPSFKTIFFFFEICFQFKNKLTVSYRTDK